MQFDIAKATIDGGKLKNINYIFSNITLNKSYVDDALSGMGKDFDYYYTNEKTSIKFVNKNLIAVIMPSRY